MRRLRYTGELPKSFTENGVGEVETGAEFDVPADQAERYLRRSDVEDAGGSRKRRKDASADAPGAEGQPPALTLTSEQDGPLTETVSTDPAAAE